MKTAAVLFLLLITISLNGQIINDEGLQFRRAHVAAILGELDTQRIVSVTFGKSFSTSKGSYSVSTTYRKDNNWAPMFSYPRYRENPVASTEGSLDLQCLNELLRVISFGDTSVNTLWNPEIDTTALAAHLDSLVTWRLPPDEPAGTRQKVVAELLSNPMRADTLTRRTVGNYFTAQSQPNRQRYGNHYFIDVTFTGDKGLRITRPISAREIMFPVSFWTMHLGSRSFMLQSDVPQECYEQNFGAMPQISDTRTFALMLCGSYCY